MELENKRLAVCAELIAEDGFPGDGRIKCAADVGTDHGYLAAYLAGTGICGSVTACDINEKPLSTAKRTVSEQGLSDKVKLILSDGLDSVPPDGITHIICAGMGGELIAEIILRCEWARNAHLVLQPMTKADALRKALYDNGFRVLKERAQRDGDFVYSIMLAEYSTEPPAYPCDDRYLAAGRISPADGRDAAEYILMRAGRLRRAGEGMLSSSSESARDKGRRLTALADRLEHETEGYI